MGNEDLIRRVENYLSCLAPHVRERLGAQLLEELLEAYKDEKQMGSGTPKDGCGSPFQSCRCSCK